MKQEQRLTKYLEDKWIENHDNDQRKGWSNGCMTRLAEYENTGLLPVEIEELKTQISKRSKQGCRQGK